MPWSLPQRPWRRRVGRAVGAAVGAAVAANAGSAATARSPARVVTVAVGAAVVVADAVVAAAPVGVCLPVSAGQFRFVHESFSRSTRNPCRSAATAGSGDGAVCGERRVEGQPRHADRGEVGAVGGAGVGGRVDRRLVDARPVEVRLGDAVAAVDLGHRVVRRHERDRRGLVGGRLQLVERERGARRAARARGRARSAGVQPSTGSSLSSTSPLSEALFSTVAPGQRLRFAAENWAVRPSRGGEVAAGQVVALVLVDDAEVAGGGAGLAVAAGAERGDGELPARMAALAAVKNWGAPQ